MNISRICSRFNMYYSKDDKIVNNLILRLLNHYTYYDWNKQKQQIKLQDFSSGFGPLKPRFKRDFDCSIPWIDHSMWDIIKQGNRQSLPSSIKCGAATFTSGEKVLPRTRRQRKLFREEVIKSDRECWKSYTTRERWLSSHSRNTFARAGILAAKECGILQGVHGRKDTLKKNFKLTALKTSKDSNSCYPLFDRKNSTRCIKDTENWLIKLFNKPSFYSVFNNPVLSMPTYILYRTQPSINDDNSVDVKIRQVWGQPQRIIALENYFFSNILDHVKLNNVSIKDPIYSSGLNDYEISIKMVSRLRSQISNDNHDFSLYSMDYSKYDRSIPSFATDLFFSICKETLELDESEDKIFEILRLYLKHTPFCYDGKIFFKKRGISSGSYLTNLLDTWFNLTLWILSRNLLSLLSPNLSYFNSDNILESNEFRTLIISNYFDRNICLCGDDVLIYTHKHDISIHKTICLALSMNITSNVVINNTDQYTYFLGRYWDQFSRPKHKSIYMTTHIVFRTKWYKKSELDIDISKELAITRILSICLVLSNGLDYILKTFSEYDPILNFLSSNKSFKLLKDWPNENYIDVSPQDSLSWESIARLK